MLNLSSYDRLGDAVQVVFDTYKTMYGNNPYTLRNSDIVKKEIKPMQTGEYIIFSEGISLDRYATERDEGSDSASAEIQLGYEKSVKMVTYTEKIAITKRSRDAGKYNVIQDSINLLADAPHNRLELDLAHRLTYAWDATYITKGGKTVDTTTGDGLPLVYSAHLLKGASHTYTNMITNNPVFSQGALETAERVGIENCFDNVGNIIESPEYDTIITTNDPVTCNAVAQLLNSMSDPTGSHDGVYNNYTRKYRHLKVPKMALSITGGLGDGSTSALLAKRRGQWFLASSKRSTFKLGILNDAYLNMPGKGKSGEDFGSENWYYLSGIDYGIAILSANWILGSKADGTAT